MADPANVRIHDERNIGAIKASLARFGQQKPIVVDKKGVVRAGNGTLAAALALGWEWIECTTTTLEGAEATAYAIADNRTAELAMWDEDALAKQLEAIKIDDATLAEVTGYTLPEIDELVGHDPHTEEDATTKALYESVGTPLKDEEIPKHGSVWRIGMSTLVVASPVTDLMLWRPLLSKAEVFVPYPSMFVFMEDGYAAKIGVWVQPIPLAAAHLIRNARIAGIPVEEAT
jgi:hypothetical protein